MSFIDSGYKKFYINGVCHREHRYVMEKYLGRKLRKDEIVHHINHDRLDNRIENLMIMTPSEHSKIHHSDKYWIKIENGKIGKFKSKLTTEDVRKIRELKGKMTQNEIGKIFNISRQSVGFILTNRRWRNIEEDEAFLNNSKDLENKVTTAEKEMSYRDSVEENY